MRSHLLSMMLSALCLLSFFYLIAICRNAMLCFAPVASSHELSKVTLDIDFAELPSERSGSVKFKYNTREEHGPDFARVWMQDSICESSQSTRSSELRSLRSVRNALSYT